MKSPTRPFPRLRPILGPAAAIACLTSAHAANYTWGGGNSTWTDTSASGWNGGPPTNGDSATINTGSVATTTNNQQGNVSVTVGGTGMMRSAGYYLTPGALTFSNGGTVSLQNTGHYANYGGGWLPSTVTVTGTAASGSSMTGDADNAFWNLTNGTIFNVADVSGNTNVDLTVSAGLKDAVGSPDTTWTSSGIVKNGAGTMKLTAVNGYSGGTIVNAGTLELAGASGGTGLINGAVTVNSNATIALTGGDGTGFGWNNTISTLTVNGGTANAAGGTHVGFGSYVSVTLKNGGTITGGWQWNGDNLLGFNSSGDITNTISGSLVLRSDAGANHTFQVADGAAAIDLLVSANLSDLWPGVNWLAPSALLKTGTGTMLLTGTTTYYGATSVNGGTLQLGDGTSGHDGTLANTSGISIASGASLVFNRFGNLTSGVAISGAGSVIKTGPGTQTLTGANSYSGGTTVSAGTLIADSAGTLGSGNVTVSAGGSCEIRNPAGAISDVASVYLTGTGTLTIATGVTEVVSALYIDGVSQGVGLYNASSLASHIVGGGSLQVVSGTVSIATPQTRQIIQRNGSNTAAIIISGTYTGTPERIEARATVMTGTGNNGTPTGWTTIVNTPAGGTFSGTLTGIAAGGWYQIEARSVSGGTPISNTSIVQRVGVGDLYLTAGQSNSANHGEPGINTDDRVSAKNYADGAWTLAADPMPGASGTGGSVWTRLGTLLTSASNVPVGFVCVGVGGTPVSYWVPPATDGYLRLKAAAQALPANGFRAVLWHQGESDSYYSTTTADYQTRLSSAIAQLRTDAGWAMPWYVAEASDLSGTTLIQEEPVMAGQRRVIYGDPQVFAGPATDDFHLEGKLYDGVHFNNAGMADHAHQWAQLLAGTAPLAPKNGNLESNTALVDGGIAVVNMGDVSSPSVIGWRILNASGEAAADGSNGYYNPDGSFYTNAGDGGSNGGVLPNMSGRHAAFLYAGSNGNHFLQTRRATLQPKTTYSLAVALGVRGNANPYGNARIELLADGVSIASRDVTLADLNTLNGGTAANKFTDVQVTCTTGTTVTAGQALAIRITKINGQISGNPAYVDFDNVRLSIIPSDYDTWASANQVTGGMNGDDDHDGLTNFTEYAFGLDPNSGGSAQIITGMPSPSNGTITYSRRKPSLTGLSHTVWTSTDLSHWTKDTGATEGISIVNGDLETVPVTLSSDLLSHPKLFIQVRAE